MRLDLFEFEQRLAAQHTSLDVLKATCREAVERIPADVWCAVQLDPSTLLDTGGSIETGFPPEYVTRVFEVEHFTADEPGDLRALASSSAATRLLSRAMGGRLEESAYYRAILRPQGLGDELRIALRNGPHLWAIVVLCRTAGGAPFTTAEEEFAARLSGPATDALRRTLLLEGTDTGELPDAPGRLVLDRQGAVLSASPTARTWLDLLEEDPEHLRRFQGAIDATLFSGTARTEFPVHSGAVLSVHAWSTSLDGDQVVAVSLGPSPWTPLSAVVLGAYGLTDREEEVARRTLHGYTPERIAEHLGLSPDTVRGHLASIFEKTGLKDRRSFVADILCRHYLPFFGRGPLSTDGRRLPGAAG